MTRRAMTDLLFVAVFILIFVQEDLNKWGGVHWAALALFLWSSPLGAPMRPHLTNAIRWGWRFVGVKTR